MVKEVNEIKKLMTVVMKKLQEYGFLEVIRNDCSVCEAEPNDCDKLKSYVQEITNQWVIQFTKSKIVEEVSVIEPITTIYRKKQIKVPVKKIQPINICFSGPFSYQSNKVVPLRYDSTAYIGGKSIQFSKAQIVNIARIGGMTRSGRVFDPKFTPKIASPIITTHKEEIMSTNPSPQKETSSLILSTSIHVTTVVTNAPRVKKHGTSRLTEVTKGKEIMDAQAQLEGHKKNVSSEEGQEFLKLTKKSDFKIVDQLGQTPSTISILSLLLSSKAHRTALMKVLNAEHVMHDIIIDQFDEVVTNITTNRYLGFNDAGFST